MKHEATLKKITIGSNKFGEPEHQVVFIVTNQDTGELQELMGKKVRLTVEEEGQ